MGCCVRFKHTFYQKKSLAHFLTREREREEKQKNKKNKKNKKAKDLFANTFCLSSNTIKCTAVKATANFNNIV